MNIVDKIEQYGLQDHIEEIRINGDWLPFEKAREIVRLLRFKSHREWCVWAKSDARPANIPFSPEVTYKVEWSGWYNWLGKEWMLFDDAKSFARLLGLKSGKEWSVWVKTGAKPDDIPRDPPSVYKGKGWDGWCDWLGTKKRSREWRYFEQARAFVRPLGFQNTSEWREWAKTDAKPDDIPANPSYVYKDKGWTFWYDWLGTNNRKGGWQSFKKARAFARSLGFKSGDEWRAWTKTDEKSDNIPVEPAGVYENKGWVSWGDWLGTERTANQLRVFRPFKQAREYILSLGFQNTSEWREWVKTDAKPDDIPAEPAVVYKDEGWISAGDWLGTGFVAQKKRKYRPFKQAREFARLLKLKGQSEWVEWAKTDVKPDDIPANPSHVYKGKGWVSWADWSGRTWRPFEKARAFVRSVGIKSHSEWRAWARTDARPHDIPFHPQGVYRNKGWISWPNWMGKI